MKLIEYMPPFLKDVREFIRIFEAEDKVITKLNDDIKALTNEVIVKTANSYGIEKYEKIYRIKNKSETIETRRLNILLKINNRVPYTLKWLIKTLNETIGENSYTLTVKDYQLNMIINLAFTELAEILKSNLKQQIPANIKISYQLETELNKFVGATISRQDYITIEGCENYGI